MAAPRQSAPASVPPSNSLQPNKWTAAPRPVLETTLSNRSRSTVPTRAGTKMPAGPEMKASLISLTIDYRKPAASGLTNARAAASEIGFKISSRSPFALNPIIVRRYSSSLDAPLLHLKQLGIFSKRDHMDFGIKRPGRNVVVGQECFAPAIDAFAKFCILAVFGQAVF